MTMYRMQHLMSHRGEEDVKVYSDADCTQEISDCSRLPYGTYYYQVSCSGCETASGSAGSGGASGGTEVYVRGGNININCDYTGSAVGGGGYASGNDASGGTVYITGGSLRTYIDKNAASNENYNGWNGSAFTESVNDAVITALRKNADGEDVYKCVFDTTELGEGPYTVLVDGQLYYSGGRHAWAYINESLSKHEGEQISVARTQDNWIPNDEPNLYFYLTGEDHTISVNGASYQAVFDTSVLDADGNVTDSRVYTDGAFTVTEAAPACVVEAYAGGYSLVKYTPAAVLADSVVPAYDGHPMYLVPAKEGDEVSYAYLTDEALTAEEAAEKIAVVDGIAKTAAYPDADTETEIAGDLNGNGVVNIVDAQIAWDLASGKYTLSDSQTDASVDMLHWLMADVNRDEAVDAADARAIQVYVHTGTWGSSVMFDR